MIQRGSLRVPFEPRPGGIFMGVLSATSTTRTVEWRPSDFIPFFIFYESYCVFSSFSLRSFDNSPFVVSIPRRQLSYVGVEPTKMHQITMLLVGLVAKQTQHRVFEIAIPRRASCRSFSMKRRRRRSTTRKATAPVCRLPRFA